MKTKKELISDVVDAARKYRREFLNTYTSVILREELRRQLFGAVDRLTNRCDTKPRAQREFGARSIR